MNNYIYILPHKIQGVSDGGNQVRIITQRSSILQDKGNFLEVMKRVLRGTDGSRAGDIYESVKDRVNRNNFQNILRLLRENHVIYMSEDLLEDGDIRLLHFISQYTSDLDKYLSRVKEISFYLLAEGQCLAFMKEILGGFGLNYILYSKEKLEKNDKENIILACLDATDLDMLPSMAEEIEAHPDLMWIFVLFYDNSFLLSPILNRANYIDFYSFKRQVDLERFRGKGISKNIFVQRMGVCEMILDALTSILRLGIQTGYDKAIMYDSIDKTFISDRIYYFSGNFLDNELKVNRWDGEL